MAKKQRGETVVSAAENMDKHAENLSLLLDSSDDEAPEEVTFEESKSDALRSLKEALHTARREKKELKEKRRRRHELFQEQKERRLLPNDVLEEIDRPSSSRRRKPAEDQASDEDRKRVKRQKKLPGSRNFQGSYTVTTVKEGPSVSVQQQAAQDFIRSRLYGPGCCRTTNNELLSVQNKTSGHKSAAVQFVNKHWASKERVKAEKLKKRWLHKQQTHTC